MKIFIAQQSTQNQDNMLQQREICNLPETLFAQLSLLYQRFC